MHLHSQLHRCCHRRCCWQHIHVSRVVQQLAVVSADDAQGLVGRGGSGVRQHLLNGAAAPAGAAGRGPCLCLVICFESYASAVLPLLSLLRGTLSSASPSAAASSAVLLLLACAAVSEPPAVAAAVPRLVGAAAVVLGAASTRLTISAGVMAGCATGLCTVLWAATFACTCCSRSCSSCCSLSRAPPLRG
ncbi:hypothetical protein COO60DRAFT_1472527, partial [Scenedesmus sp. NREL 46B-D3]